MSTKYICTANCQEMVDDTTKERHHCIFNSFEQYTEMLNQHGGGCYCGNTPIIQEIKQVTNEEHLKSLNTAEFALFLAEHDQNNCKHCANFLNWYCNHSCNSDECVSGYIEWLTDKYTGD